MKYVLIIILSFPFIVVGQVYIDSSERSSISDPVWKLGKHSSSIGYVVLSMDEKSDTIPSSILISGKAPSFGHSIDGYCIYKYGECTGRHLKMWHKKLINIPSQYTVWYCKSRLVKGRMR